MAGVLFHEQQKARIWWLTVVIVGLTILAWAQFIQQVIRDRPFGDEQSEDWVSILILLLMGIALPVLIWQMRMETTVEESGITIAWRPFTTRKLTAEQVESWVARTYKPVREFGGWGVKGWGNKRAYNVSGNEGVELRLTDGRQVMIGSRRSNELAAAISTMVERRAI